MEIFSERRRTWSLQNQLHAFSPLLLLWTVTVVLLYVSAAQDRVPTERLFLDAASLSDQPWYTGLLHEMGVLGWTVAATAAAAGAWVASLTNRRSALWFLGSGAVLTLMLLIDDVTAFHSDFGPKLGFPKYVCVGMLGLASVFWFVSNWHEIVRTRWLTLFAALGALATAVVVDVGNRDSDFHVFFEDAPKLLGIVGWATYFVFTSLDVTKSVVRTREETVVAV